MEINDLLRQDVVIIFYIRVVFSGFLLCVSAGFAISGFQVDAVDQVVLNLQDEVQQTWKPGDLIVVASTDYSMHQAEEFTLLPCRQCTSRQVKIQGK